MRFRPLALKLVAPLLAVALVAVPARSATPGASLLLPPGCIYGGTAVDYRVDGLAALRSYSVTIGSKTVASGTTDASGHAAGQLRAPDLTLSERLLAVEASDGTSAAAGAITVTAFDVYLTPPGGSTGRAVRVSLFGWLGRTVYVHYVAAGAKRARRSVRVARTSGLCGSARTRLRHLFPFSPRAGGWRLVFDENRGYHRGSRPRVVYRTAVDSASSR